MKLELQDKVAVVTGASQGIGLATVKALAREGVRVVAGARGTTAELDALARSYDVLPVCVDLATADGPAALVERAVATYGGLDLLVNNVGASRPRLDGFLASPPARSRPRCGRGPRRSRRRSPRPRAPTSTR